LINDGRGGGVISATTFRCGMCCLFEDGDGGERGGREEHEEEDPTLSPLWSSVLPCSSLENVFRAFLYRDRRGGSLVSTLACVVGSTSAVAIVWILLPFMLLLKGEDDDDGGGGERE
jgi:hypothetical protein